jgi:hypothetical protein
LAYALFLFPSLNFWSAGVLKEGLLIFSLGNIFYVTCLLLYKKQNLFYLLLALFSFFVMLYLKSYALAAMGLGLCGLIIGFLFKNKNIGWIYTGLAASVVGLLVLLTYTYPQYNIPEIITQKQVDFTRFSLHMKSGSFFSIGELGGNWGDLLRLSPYAFYTGLFRPTFLDITNPMMLMSALESFLFMLGIILSIAFFKKPEKHQVNMLLCCVVIILVLCTIIGLATANFGSLVRYKVPAIPFIIFMCICLIDVVKVKAIWQKVKK